MSKIGEIEKKTQARVVDLFRYVLGYDYLGHWKDESGKSNIENSLLRSWLSEQGVSADLVSRAVQEFERVAGNTSIKLEDRNREVYDLLRYGVKVSPGIGENNVTVSLINWESPEANYFAIAEEVPVSARDRNSHSKRPDIVLYVNGIALGVLELKRSTVSVGEGIRQNLDNQKKEFIEHFFSTIQFVMAGNDAEGLRYGTIKTPEKHYLTWKEPGSEVNPLLRSIAQICTKGRFLELIHDFVVFDAGIKKLCRHNQYFGIKAAQDHVKRREGGIIWHTQGSGKSLTMVWLAKWIAENVTNSRILVITDRTELDEQIEKVFKGVKVDIYRTKSGTDLIAKINATMPPFMCSLIQKFGGREDGDISGFVKEIKAALPDDFQPKGDLYVFVDECHRTQSGDLHEAMRAILPDAMFIGFTGTPLLKKDKKKTIEVFGPYIHTYKFNEAIEDSVVVDLRYEARKIDQEITSETKIDQWFDAKTKGLTPLAKAELKKRWGNLQQVLSSRSRLQKIVDDILFDMEVRDRLKSGHGNAMLVAGSIYEACKFYELFSKTPLKDKCAIVTSYAPSAADLKGEESGEGDTENIEKYKIYLQMLADWFHEDTDNAIKRAAEFEHTVKKKFIDEPGQMKLLIVVDKLLTGFDAPSATYLYIDKQMRDHGLFQAICRVNRLDGDDKEYGYIIDYKNLFQSLESAVHDYTSGAFDTFEADDVAGLLEDRVEKAREKLEEALDAIRALCEPVEPPKDDHAYYRYFSAAEHGNVDQLRENEPRRLSLYKLAASLTRAYANIANEMLGAGYSLEEAAAIKEEVALFDKLRSQIKLHSGDAIDLKQYEPAMRHLIDTYIGAYDSTRVTAFDDLSLVTLLVQKGPDAVKSLPDRMQREEAAVAETIENNVRKVIIDETPINPKYYEKMSELLDALIKERRDQALKYEDYLARITELARQIREPKGLYPEPPINTPARRALYDILNQDVDVVIALDEDIQLNKPADFRDSSVKLRRMRQIIQRHVSCEELVDHILEIVKAQRDY